MLSFVRNRFTFANVALTLALVFAMSGGALAASKYLITSSKQIKPSVLASLKGKAGANGAQGAAGAQGPAGPAGAKGENGAAGANGSAGTDGASVASTPLGVGNEHCKEGGNEYVSASGPSYACNGKAGKEGKEGSPWTAGGTLPPEKTETGSWAVGNVIHSQGRHWFIALSFPIMLKEPLEATHVHFIEESGNEFGTGKPPTECGTPAGTSTEPKASPGNLCVYEAVDNSMFFEKITRLTGSQEAGASTTGALINMVFEEEVEGFAWGAWAVTEK